MYQTTSRKVNVNKPFCRQEYDSIKTKHLRDENIWETITFGTIVYFIYGATTSR